MTSEGELLLTCAKPGKGKSAVLAVLLANLNIGAADVPQCFVQDSQSLAQGVGAFGNADEEQPIVPICHAGDAHEAQPVGGMFPMQDAGGCMGEAAAAHKLLENAELTGVSSDAGIVVVLNGMPNGEVEHGNDAAQGAEVCKAQPEGAGSDAGVLL